MHKLVFLVAAVLLAGCAPGRRDEPVSQDKSARSLKSIGQLLREAALKLRGVEDVVFYQRKITRSLDYLGSGQFTQNKFSALADSIEQGGEEAIRHFKLHPIRSLLLDYTDIGTTMTRMPRIPHPHQMPHTPQLPPVKKPSVNFPSIGTRMTTILQNKISSLSLSQKKRIR